MQKLLHILLWTLAAGVGAVACITFYVIAATNSSMYSNVADVPHAEVGVVLGASIRASGALSAVLAERADRAVELYKAQKVDKLLVTGDNSTLTYDEVYPVGKYLVAEGVPQSDIFLDYAGFDTYSSMYRARDVFAVHSMIIVSQRYHLPRALFIAHSLGLEAAGLDASQAGEKFLYNSLREVPASVKAALDVALRRVPKYLGQQFPITGDGATTWVGSDKAKMIYFTP